MTTRFRYRAANPAGEIVAGRVSSESRSAAMDDLRGQRLFPIEIEEEVSALPRRRSSIGRREARALWARSMATMLGAGVSLDRALSFSGAHERNQELQRVIGAMRADVHRGVSLAGAMRKHSDLFGAVDVALISAGEESGAQAVVMSQLATHLEEESELRARVRSALVYPALMALVTTLGLVVMVLFVIPRLTAMLDEAGGTLPYSASLLIGFSSFIVTWWPMVVAVLLLLGWEFRRWSRVPVNRVRWHAFRLGIPVAGDVEREFAAARFTRTFALLLSNGIPILSALRIARATVSNDFLAEGIERAIAGVRQGRRLSGELAGVLPPGALQLLNVGEETGKLGELSLRAAETYELDLARRLKTAIGLIEPALILFFGGVVGFVAIALLQAIYSINGRL